MDDRIVADLIHQQCVQQTITAIREEYAVPEGTSVTKMEIFLQNTMQVELSFTSKEENLKLGPEHCNLPGHSQQLIEIENWLSEAGSQRNSDSTVTVKCYLSPSMFRSFNHQLAM